MQCFYLKPLQVEWNNPQEPLKGFQYLYLVDEDYQSIISHSPDLLVKATPLTVGGNSMTQISRWCNVHYIFIAP